MADQSEQPRFERVIKTMLDCPLDSKMMWETAIRIKDDVTVDVDERACARHVYDNAMYQAGGIVGKKLSLNRLRALRDEIIFRRLPSHLVLLTNIRGAPELRDVSSIASEYFWGKIILTSTRDKFLWGSYPSEKHEIEGKLVWKKPAKVLADCEAVLMRNYTGYILRDHPNFQAWAAHIANVWNTEQTPAKIKVAKGAEEIVNVYVNGPRSCMGKATDNFMSRPLHPTLPYDSPDIDLVYAAKGDRIVSRCLINKVHKSWVRVYGNHEALAPYLKDFAQGSLKDCRLKLVQHDNKRIMFPYLDGGVTTAVEFTDEEGSWLKVQENGNYSGGELTGFATVVKTVPCECCGTPGRESSLVQVYTQPDDLYIYQQWCSSCASRYSVRAQIRGLMRRVDQRPNSPFKVYKYLSSYYDEDALTRNELVWSEKHGVLRLRYATQLEDGTWVRSSSLKRCTREQCTERVTNLTRGAKLCKFHDPDSPHFRGLPLFPDEGTTDEYVRETESQPWTDTATGDTYYAQPPTLRDTIARTS